MCFHFLISIYLSIYLAPRNLPYADEQVQDRFVSVALAVLRKMACSQVRCFPLSGDFIRLLGPVHAEQAQRADARVARHLARYGAVVLQAEVEGEESEDEGAAIMVA